MPTEPEARIATGVAAKPSDGFERELASFLDDEKPVPGLPVDDAADVEAQRKEQLRKLFEGAESVDLVGHSTPIHRYLRLGNWVLTPEETERLPSYMPASVKEVRLIGCATASTEAGRKAVQALARGGLAAAGTRGKVYMTHFHRRGVRRGLGGPPVMTFSPSTERPSATSAPPASPASPAQAPPAKASPRPVVRTHAPDLALAPRVGWWVRRPLVWLVRSISWVITMPIVLHIWLFRGFAAMRDIPHRRVLWLLSSRSSPMPGLLTDPLLIFEIASKRKSWTLEILFDFELVRFYSSTDSPAKRERVYRVRRGLREIMKAVLRRYLRTSSEVQLTYSHPEAQELGWPAPKG